MIIIQVMGGLGNQLQQYALYHKFLQLGKEAKLDLSWFEDKKEDGVTERTLELAYFEKLPYEACTKREKKWLIGSEGISGKLRRKLLSFTVKWFHESQIYHPEVLEFKDKYLSGYFACEKYYSDILPDLRNLIKFPKSMNSANDEMAKRMQSGQSVSVHIRRGDYLKPENAAMFGNICTDAYYDTAMAKIREEVPDVHFYLFSDDVSYVEKKYQGDEYTIVDINHGDDSFYDIWLMSQCKHNICANSTFSFWGARLNDNVGKIMIRPTIHKNSQVFVKEEMAKLWQGWRFISPSGEEV